MLHTHVVCTYDCIKKGDNEVCWLYSSVMLSCGGAGMKIQSRDQHLLI